MSLLEVLPLTHPLITPILITSLSLLAAVPSLVLRRRANKGTTRRDEQPAGRTREPYVARDGQQAWIAPEKALPPPLIGAPPPTVATGLRPAAMASQLNRRRRRRRRQQEEEESARGGPGRCGRTRSAPSSSRRSLTSSAPGGGSSNSPPPPRRTTSPAARRRPCSGTTASKVRGRARIHYTLAGS